MQVQVCISAGVQVYGCKCLSFRMRTTMEYQPQLTDNTNTCTCTRIFSNLNCPFIRCMGPRTRTRCDCEHLLRGSSGRLEAKTCSVCPMCARDDYLSSITTSYYHLSLCHRSVVGSFSANLRFASVILRQWDGPRQRGQHHLLVIHHANWTYK